MVHPDEQSPRLYSLEDANRALPLVRAIVEDIVGLAQRISDRRHHLEVLMPDSRRGCRDPYSEELQDVQLELDQQQVRLREYAEELGELGVELKDARAGRVDFPALLNGRIIYLCWQLGEPEVGHWHDLDVGYAGRQAIEDFWVAGSRPEN